MKGHTIDYGQIAVTVDGSGNTFSAASGQQIASLTGAGVAKLAFVNGVLWQINASGVWQVLLNSCSDFQFWSTYMGLPEITTFVTTVGPVLIGPTNGETFALNSSAQITVNGTVDITSSNVVGILSWNGLVYKKVGVNVESATIPYGYDYYDWYFKAISTDAWSGKVCDPRLPVPTNFIDITAPPYNAVGDGSTDNQTAIQNALNAATTAGKAVRVPAGTFNHSGSLNVNDVALFGTGNASILKATTNANSAIQLSGDSPSITNLWLECPNTTRLTGPYQAAGIWPSPSCTNFAIQNVIIHGSACPAIYNQGATYGVIEYVTALNSKSDSITQTWGAKRITVNGCRVVRSGDDCYSHNSYPGDPSKVSDVVLTENSGILNAFARGLEVSGADNITFNGNFHVQDQSANPLCNMWVATEDVADTGFNTQGVANFTAKNNCLVNAGANQGAILLGPWNISFQMSAILLANNEIINPASNPVQIEGNAVLTGSIVGTLVYETNTGQVFANNTATKTSGFAISGTTTIALASWPGTYSVQPGGGCGTIGAPGYVSPQGFVVNKALAKIGYAIYDDALNVYSINAAGNIIVNGGVIAGTSSVVFLLWYNDRVYQMNASNNWYGPVTLANGGTLTTDPRL